MTVDISNLQYVINILLSKLIERKGEKIEIENDFYWELTNNELYNPYEEPTEVSLGQLSHNLEALARLEQHSDEAIPYDLNRVATILKALSVENEIAF